MPGVSIFADWAWNLPLPEPFDGIEKRHRSDVTSRYNAMTRGKRATLHPSMLRAILTYMAMERENVMGDSEAPGAIGTRKNGEVTVAEYPSHTGELQPVVYDSESGRLMAARYTTEDNPQYVGAYSISRGQGSFSALFFAMIPTAMKDEEFRVEYEKLHSCSVMGYPDLEEAVKSATVLCDNLYRRVKDGDSLGEAGIKVVVTANLPAPAPHQISRGEFAPERTAFGNFRIFRQGEASTAPVQAEDFIGKYRLDESRELTAAERSLVPTLEPWYVIPPQVRTICGIARQTTESYVPVRNILLRGPAGTGKTEASKAVAAGVNLPHLHITCSAGTVIEDLLGQLLPITEEERPNGELPSLEDIFLDPASAYYKLTGEYKEIALNDVYEKLLEKVTDRIWQETSDGTTRYRYVESPLVEGLRNGYVVEIQEPSCITNPGVLVGLNSLLDNCKSMVLPTGRTILRHPDAMAIITTNLDYEGTRGMNQSVLSRMQLKIDLKEPDERTMAERVMKVTGCAEQDVVRRMVKCVRNMAAKCRAGMINDGSVGMRELISWVQTYMVLHDAVEAAQYTLIPSATADEECQSELKSECLDPLFAA